MELGLAWPVRSERVHRLVERKWSYDEAFRGHPQGGWKGCHREVRKQRFRSCRKIFLWASACWRRLMHPSLILRLECIKRRRKRRRILFLPVSILDLQEGTGTCSIDIIYTRLPRDRTPSNKSPTQTVRPTKEASNSHPESQTNRTTGTVSPVRLGK